MHHEGKSATFNADPAKSTEPNVGDGGRSGWTSGESHHERLAALPPDSPTFFAMDSMGSGGPQEGHVDAARLAKPGGSDRVESRTRRGAIGLLTRVGSGETVVL